VRYLALAADYDGVVASEGKASKDALAALQRLRLSGRRVILITGRRLSHLQESCPDLSSFDCVVAENGAVVYEPRKREETLLARPLPSEFVQRLRGSGSRTRRSR
jgi:hydroxymethylpyrimidine pyrophosphatase-like HAD family hydrolase